MAFFHIVGRGVQIFVQQGLGADDHARNTESALHRASLSEGVHIHVALALSQALHSGDVLAVQLFQPKHTRFGFFAVHKDRAGSARALAAAVFHAGQPQIIPQIIQQFAVLFGVVLHTVHIQSVHASLLIVSHTVRRIRPWARRPLPLIPRPHTQRGAVRSPQSPHRAYNPHSGAASLPEWSSAQPDPTR